MTRARAVSCVDPRPRLIATFALMAIVALGFASLARADDAADDRIITAHGFSEFGDLKYGPGFEHFEYVNPEAPRGGELSFAAQGTFDSFNPYAKQGRAAARSSEHYESLMVQSYDEPESQYGLLAESLEYPESQDWVIFNLRPEARFSDGSPVTADDVVFSHNILLDQGLQSYADAVSKRIDNIEVIDDHTGVLQKNAIIGFHNRNKLHPGFRNNDALRQQRHRRRSKQVVTNKYG